MYDQSEWRTETTRDVYKRHRYVCRMEGNKVVRHRGRKERPTPAAMAEYNKKIAQRKLTRKINANFHKGDLYLTLTYPREGRPTPERAQKDLNNCIDRLRRRFKKEGKTLKWVARTEIGSRGGIHHHMIIPFTDIRMIQEMWSRYGGHVSFQTLRGNDFSKLAAYFLKPSGTEGIPGVSQQYRCSRNLIEPKEHRKKVKANSWKEEPVVPAGWYLDKDSLDTGINPITGYGYQYYRLIKLE